MCDLLVARWGDMSSILRDAPSGPEASAALTHCPVTSSVDLESAKYCVTSRTSRLYDQYSQTLPLVWRYWYIRAALAHRPVTSSVDLESAKYCVTSQTSRLHDQRIQRRSLWSGDTGTSERHSHIALSPAVLVSE